MTITQFLDADIALVKSKLPPEIQTLGAEFPLALIQAAQGIGFEPLSAEAKPKLIEVYRNGESTASLVFHGEQLVSCVPNFLTATNDAAIVVEVDAIFRYAEILGVEVLHTLGEYQLPQVLSDPAVLAQVVTSLLSQ